MIELNQPLTKEEIKEELQNYLKDEGYEGEILQILKGLLGESTFLTQLASAVVLKESNIMTATEVSSHIAICHENFVKVPRGMCQRINLTNLIVVKTKSVKAFDLFTSVGSWKLYYLDDGNYEANQSGVSVRLLVAKDCVSYDNSGDLDKRLSSSGFYLDIPEDGWSEDFLLYKNNSKIYNVDDVPIELHSEDSYKGLMYTKDANKLSNIVPYYIATTAPNYGIRIYSYIKFNEQDKYSFKGLKLMSVGQGDLDPKLIKNLEGFLLKNNILTYENTPSTEAESNISVLKMLALANFRDRNLISSNYGLKQIIEFELSNIFLGFRINYIGKEIRITYILREGQSWDLNKEKQFVDKVVFNYKITEKMVFEEAKPVYVRLFIRVVYNNLINNLDIFDQISKFEEKVGGVYYLDELKSVLSKNETVSRVEILKPTDLEGYGETMRSGEPGVTESDGEWVTSSDEVVPLEFEVEEEIKGKDGLPIMEDGRPKTTTVTKIVRLKFDEINKTGNPGANTNKLIMFYSEVQGK